LRASVPRRHVRTYRDPDGQRSPCWDSARRMATRARAMMTAVQTGHIDRPGDLLFAAGALPTCLPRLQWSATRPTTPVYKRGRLRRFAASAPSVRPIRRTTIATRRQAAPLRASHFQSTLVKPKWGFVGNQWTTWKLSTDSGIAARPAPGGNVFTPSRDGSFMFAAIIIPSCCPLGCWAQCSALRAVEPKHRPAVRPLGTHPQPDSGDRPVF